MKRILLFFILVFSMFSVGFSQTKVLGRPIVSKMDDEIAPYIAANGRSMVFMQRDFRHPHFTIVYSEKKNGEWTRPVDVDPPSKHGKLLLKGSYCLTEDGTTLYFSSKRHPSVGDYDIWVSHLKNGAWSAPENIGKPVNSKFADTYPSISSDGNTMYFSRSLGYSHNNTANCSQLMMSKKRGSMWSEAVPVKELNAGCELAPRIMADNQTMIFASKRNGKKDFDFYMSRKENGVWGKAALVSEISTDEDDLFCSMAADGKFVFHDKRVGESVDLVRTILSETDRPKTVRMYRFRGFDESLSGRLVIRDVLNKKTSAKTKLSKTYKTLYLPEGSWYDVSYYAKDKIYYSEFIDATDESFRFGMENRSVKLKSVVKGVEFELTGFFNADSSRLDQQKSLFEFKRAARLIREYNGVGTLVFSVLEEPVLEDTLTTQMDSLKDSISDSLVVAPVIVKAPKTIKLKREEEFTHRVYSELKKYLKEPEKLNYKVEYLPEGSDKIGQLWIRLD